MDDILLTWAKHLYDPIISIKGEVWDYTTSLALSLFIEVLVLSQESESLCICMLEVLIFLLDFGTVSTVWYFWLSSHCNNIDSSHQVNK